MFFTVHLRSLVKTFAIIVVVSIALTVLGTIRSAGSEEPVIAMSSEAERTLVIDAGHGGLDGGAIGLNGTVESGINLDIALKMRDLALFCGQSVVMTRSSEDIKYPDESSSIASKKVSDQKMRVELIRSVPGAFLVSIHQNKYTSPSPRGAQVFFRDNEESRTFAELMQERLNEKLVPNGRRVAAPISRDIYIMKVIECPAVLVECGFLSNPDECAQLSDETYRTKLALTLISVWFEQK